VARTARFTAALLSSAVWLLAACGGGGGGGGSVPPPAPTVSVTANPATLMLGATSTLTIATTNAKLRVPLLRPIRACQGR
jgi:hypothetical protein